MASNLTDSEYTQSVQSLVNQIQQNSSGQNSLFELANLFFTSHDSDARVIKSCEENLKTAKEYQQTVAESKKQDAYQQMKKMEKALKDEKNKQFKAQQVRYKCMSAICLNILKLSEGVNQQQTHTKSAKLLATLFMLSSTETDNRKQMHQLYKPLYKAVLALRLLDKMLVDNNLTNKYIVDRFDPKTRFPKTLGRFTQFQLDVAVPVIIAAITQDIGMQHPEIQRLLKGADGSLDEFRVLDKGTRVPLLIMNHEQTQDFVVHGIGTSEYEGGDEDKKLRFEKKQNNRLKFVLGLLTDAVKPSQGSIGNIIKIPQIYTSFILSTKPDYNFRDLPKVVAVLNNAAKNKAICSEAAQSFINLVGHFPMGFGVLYLKPHKPEDKIEDYYYGIVTQLNPSRPDAPTCRRITDQGEICPDTKNFSLLPENNLFYPEVQKNLSNLSIEKRKTLRETHMRDLKDSKLPELEAGFWNTYRYFSINKHQNLWA
ncbi:hypothetical protein [Paraglaciecola aestuariivivens]